MVPSVTNNIMRYGPPKHIVRAEWKDVIKALLEDKNDCVVCFTRNTSQRGDDDFEVTHVALPKLWLPRHTSSSSVTSTGKGPLHSSRGTATYQKDYCMCRFENPQFCDEFKEVDWYMSEKDRSHQSDLLI